MFTSPDIANCSAAMMEKLQGDLDVAKGLTLKMIRTAEQLLLECCEAYRKKVGKEGDRHEALVAFATVSDIMTKMRDMHWKMTASPDVIPGFIAEH